MECVQLQVRSTYSLLESGLTIERLVQLAVARGYKALALTDTNVLYGAMEFYHACVDAGIKPLLGIRVIVGSEAVIFLAQNKAAYQRLVLLSTLLQTTVPQPDLALLREYRDGCVVIVAEGSMETYHYLADGHAETYFGVYDAEQAATLPAARMVALGNVCYADPEDEVVRLVLQAIKQNERLTYSYVRKQAAGLFYLPTIEEMCNSFAAAPEALVASSEIADSIDVVFDFNEKYLPEYPLPDDADPKDYLTQLCWRGLYKRYGEPTAAQVERLNYELDVICSMDFADYFLVIWDFIRFARQEGIVIGPGRGSAVGSLVAYTLGITNVDPLKYGLLFERFLNPERISLPDIDIDIEDEGRARVVEYVREKYGSERVAHIITFGTFGPKAAFRDCARVFDIPSPDISAVTKQIPFQASNLKHALELVPQMQTTINRNDELKFILDIAVRIEGLARHTSTHAAGVIIGDRPLVEVVPLQNGFDNTLMTQYPMNYLEELGLLKMDFLGLRNLSIIRRVLSRIKLETGQDINITEIPLDDKKAFNIMARGETTGIFQLESAGMRRVLRDMKVSEFEDIVAALSLFRPGPMENIPVYVRRKLGQEKVTYIHKDLEPILHTTYGIIVYQEQVMQVAQKIAGYSLGRADILRRAMGKKDRAILEQERENFIQGSLEQGYTNELANHVYDLILKFANYGFNKSHAVAYAMIAYQMMYLKTHYTAIFLTELLNSVIASEGKIYEYIKEARRFGIRVLPPNVNESMSGFSAPDGQIRMGLLAIKNVGEAATKQIVNERIENGRYTSFQDFIHRNNNRSVTKRVIEQLIDAKAMSDFSDNQAYLHSMIDQTVAINELIFPGAEDLFAVEQVKVDNFSIEEQMEREKKAFGFSMFMHPTSRYSAERANMISLDQGAELIGRQVDAIVYIERIKSIKTKKGDIMVFVTFSDDSATVSATVFPNTYDRYSQILEKGAVVRVNGKFETRNDQLNFIVSQVSIV
ncbi:DNA polymerase III subunit alpha [Culicoidibacter larvae]|uniref:DNA polymerase III subunit alpha n=1 Tax=Culicoidibacter larvae TaxID=2579976 RepID=A0A5R8Q8U0_9FIRM|nr:DNA polymerase III subunit alpha [Culicoidibacter larvae]TLG72128.1 DNA polymerase III subunit alpha [Culicoidibacter larvae]